MNTNENTVSVLKFEVHGRKEKEFPFHFHTALQNLSGVIRLDISPSKNRYRLVSSRTIDHAEILHIAAEWDIDITFLPISSSAVVHQQPQEVFVAIDGMTCRSCEILIEEKLRTVNNVTHVRVDSAKGVATLKCKNTVPPLEDMQRVLRDTKYVVSRTLQKEELARYRPRQITKTRPSILRIIAAFVFAFFVSILFTKLGLLKGGAGVPESLQFGAAFLLGLVAATSSCAATVGGLLISSLARYTDIHPASSFKEKIFPVGSFLIGRVLSYGFFGGLIGFLGSAFSPAPFVTGGLVILAACYMIVMGLDMLGISVPAVSGLMPRLPKNITRRASGVQSPFLLGVATFFVPCGFTQTLQVYALTTGSLWTSASIMIAFALGTSPVLALIGLSLSAVRGKVREVAFQLSGALVVLMGIANIQNGFTIAGYPLPVNAGSKANQRDDTSSSVTFDGKEQIARMSIGYNGYEPNRFILRAGVPTRWLVDAKQASGCLGVLQSPQLGIAPVVLRDEINEIRFTAPQQPGSYAFSCSMGMFRGTITVVPNT